MIHVASSTTLIRVAPCSIVRGQLAFHRARRHADGQRARRDLHPLADERAGADQRQLADDRAVEHARAHADQRAALDRASVHDHSMSDRHFLGRRSSDRVPFVDVQNAVVLDVRPRADADAMHVAAQHGAVPDRAVVAEVDVADQRGIFGDENTPPEPRFFSLIRPHDHRARRSQTHRHNLHVQLPHVTAHTTQIDAVAMVAATGPNRSAAMPANRAEMLIVSVTNP